MWLNHFKRFGRNAADVLSSLQYIQDLGVNLSCVEDRIASSKDLGKLTIMELSAVAEIERENILVQTMEGRKKNGMADLRHLDIALTVKRIRLLLNQMR